MCALRMEPGALHILGMPSAADLHPQSKLGFVVLVLIR